MASAPSGPRGGPRPQGNNPAGRGPRPSSSAMGEAASRPPPNRPARPSFGPRPGRQASPRHFNSDSAMPPKASHPNTTNTTTITNNNNNMDARRALAASGAQSSVTEAWKTWDGLTVKLRGLPRAFTTLDLWRAFEAEGSVEAIEIFEDKQGRLDGTAKIRFRPPPEKAIWITGKYTIHSLRKTFVLPIDLVIDERTQAAKIASPVNPNIKYPRNMTLYASAIDFGFMYEENTMMLMRSVQSAVGARVAFELDLGRKHVDIRFDIPIKDPRGENINGSAAISARNALADKPGPLNRTDKLRFRIPLEQLQQIAEVAESGKTRHFVISLETPPNFYKKAAGVQLEKSHDGYSLFWSEWSTWFRQTDVLYDPRELQSASLSLRKVNPVIDIGRWTTYRLAFDESQYSSSTYQIMCQALRDYNIHVKRTKGFKTTTNREPALWDWIDRQQSGNRQASSFLDEIQAGPVTVLSFPVRYQLEVCISQGRLNEHNISKEFVDKLAQLSERRALDLLKHVALQKDRIYRPLELFEKTDIGSLATVSKVPRYCVYTRKAVVTPTTIYFNTPVVETSNRVVRQYIEHADRFLRVQFTDEKFQGRINATTKNTNDEVFSRIRRALLNGIDIGDRHYEFLAFGNSQFREHGAYFFAPTLHINAADIRTWMGDFQHIRQVAKYAARLGQCFSTTRAIAGAKVHVVEMMDVTRGDYNFTDGVGKISEALVKLVAAELRLLHVPSVLQFRLGGCKGVLAIWPEAQRWEIHIRPSQYKFAAVHNGLEVIRWSQFAAASLNRQLIVVLSALGIKDHVFVRKLRDMLANLERAMVDETLALKMLQRQVDPNQITLVIASMVSHGFMGSGEPFVLMLLQLWRAWTIKYLKERAKIVVDDGAFVLGCTDESGTLKGHFEASHRGLLDDIHDPMETLPEIFLQIPDVDTAGDYKVVKGLCLLARNPSLHPGDIRVVVAVDNPRLRHIRDAVVLPQTGERDVASMCSGGDLDGDDYLVMWDKELIPPEWNHPAMDYTPPRSKVLNRDVSSDDITGFFVQYMKNDQLPSIAHAHLAQADYRSFGVKDERCLELAALHSKAVDYVKTGEPAVMPRELRPRIWPHFMEKKHLPPDQIYVSKKVLGQLYDQVERVDFVPRFGSGFDSRVLDAYSPDEQLMADARALKAEYDADMRRIMAQHEIKTEFEVWSTFVLSHANMSRDYKFHEELGQIAFALKERYRTACEARAGGRDSERLAPFVVAMYRATRDEVTAWLAASEADDEKFHRSHTPSQDAPDEDAIGRQRRRQQQAPLISFPWCFSEALGKIALEHGDRAPAKDSETPKAPTFAHGLGRPMKTDKAAAEPANGAGAGVVETSAGVSYLGELLELFHHEGATENADAQQNTGAAPSAPSAPSVPSPPVAASDEKRDGHAQEDKVNDAASDAASLYQSVSGWEDDDGNKDDDIGKGQKHEDSAIFDEADADVDDGDSENDEFKSIADEEDDGLGADGPDEEVVVLEEKESALEALEKLLRGED